MSENNGIIMAIVCVVGLVVGLIVLLIPLSFSSIEYYEVNEVAGGVKEPGPNFIII